jgi:hypothetical protein
VETNIPASLVSQIEHWLVYPPNASALMLTRIPSKHDF